MSKRSKSKRFVKQSEDAVQPNNASKNHVRTMAEAEKEQRGE
ncbi:competence protein [Evansella sp. AB-rgal1]